ncbi:TolC family protein [Diaphorobacter sp. HDW4B]|uniref:TolC family protein n=1 Tax=Diaphorobacter sp. HDW4B TaxID=2714925 RepID=UPI00140D11A7|nr:TolC family protein [Diaphorobacter sp. HDW4B]QIL73199.1 TolC family protein [Diaphorobacter sp. HDW4B]
MRNTTTLAVAWEKALAANPGLQAAKYGAAATEGGILQSKVHPNPELAFNQEDTRSNARSSTMQINQLIELGGKREARMRIAEGEKAVAHATVFETQVALRFQLVTYFNELLLAQQRVQFASMTHELAAHAANAAEKRVQAGKVAPLEASRAQVAQANAALELQQAKSSIAVAQQNIASLWGGTAADVGEASGDFAAIAEAPTADQLETLLEAAPSMVLARHVLDQSRAASELEHAKRMQDPTVSIGVKRAKEVGRNQIVFGVSIPLPLFDRNAGNQLQALRKVDQAEQKLQEQRLQLQSQVFAARQQLLSSNQQLSLLKSRVIPTAQSAYDVSVRGFTLGKFNFLDVLDAQRTLFESQRKLLEQLMASHKARAEIDRLLGTSSMAVPSTDTAKTGI